MDYSVIELIIFGILTLVNITCTIILFPGLKEVVKELRKD